jgi:predicted component of type VI protein secretion system
VTATALPCSLARGDTARFHQVLAEARRLPFVVLVRWLQRLLHADAEGGARGTVHTRAGTTQPGGHAGPEAVRFRHDPSLGFHDADVVEATLVEPTDAPPFVQLTTSFCGLTGAASPLPPGLVEHLCRDDNDENVVHRVRPHARQRA